ncbi:MerR family transcriptional regulator [Pseudoteredinibacter isoporae]|uniref:DNA-binding transcriptional MerR regulator n=1 Tax=Pseudoteredinibacter isoporae TaxID=570281 RepID=A0A7X0JTC0_9GAMM|nr:MerR family DNA-binding transcriptional regulator [Pseudoteredinibacter isoporae]MBB6521065.1 DNA-binding transcriptional MerR regulator [Pseudoteredinibacter isoporae]NHO86629.1 MerR family DNA-binding transcriptional regulator [Pseudoteredinibacter isoporae]NIB24919.1 MerR family DNA-binding transcriptional regulator [Pseudoteredinibacter isoporae]
MEQKNKTYSISELAKEFDITTRAIRFYEDKGLLNPARRGQTRIYAPADRTKLKLILRGKRLGLTLDESRDIIGMYNPGQSNEGQLQTLLDKIRERKSYLQQQLHDIEVMMLDLQESENRALEALEQLKTD